MMSFFLLLWLLNVTTDVQRKGIADYFAPASISKSESGAGGVMGGQNITVEGAQNSVPVRRRPPRTSPFPRSVRAKKGDEDTKGSSDGGAVDSKTPPNPDAKATDSKAASGANSGEAIFPKN